MGNTLSQQVRIAFVTELVKQGAVGKVVLHGVRELAKRLTPSGITRGWKALGPKGLMNQGGPMGTAMEKAISRTGAAGKALKTRGAVPAMHEGKAIEGLLGGGLSSRSLYGPVTYSGASLPGRARAYMATKLRAGTHLAPGAETSSGVKGVAERLSREGWTGEGALTKYLPLGQKGQLGLGVAGSAPGIAQAAQHGDTGAGGVGEQLGTAAGFVLPAVALGGLPGAGLQIGGTLGGLLAGGYLGRRLDKALSPEARQQARAAREVGGK